jgi:hypothetical protein
MSAIITPDWRKFIAETVEKPPSDQTMDASLIPRLGALLNDPAPHLAMEKILADTVNQSLACSSVVILFRVMHKSFRYEARMQTYRALTPTVQKQVLRWGRKLAASARRGRALCFLLKQQLPRPKGMKRTKESEQATKMLEGLLGPKVVFIRPRYRRRMKMYNRICERYGKLLCAVDPALSTLDYSKET